MSEREDLIAKLSDEMDPEGARLFVDRVIAEALEQLPPLDIADDAALTQPTISGTIGPAPAVEPDDSAQRRSGLLELKDDLRRWERSYRDDYSAWADSDIARRLQDLIDCIEQKMPRA